MEGLMRRYLDGADVMCPFYVTDNRQQRSISCEGYSGETRLVSRFKTLAQREKHMGVYCAKRYESCPVFKCTYECKYRED